jgi:hypothetical protein
MGPAVAVGCGVAMLAIFRLEQYPSVSQLGTPSWRQVAASVQAVSVSMLVLELMESHHAPSAATALLVTTGLAKPGAPLIGLVLGPLLGRLPVSRLVGTDSRLPAREELRV